MDGQVDLQGRERSEGGDRRSITICLLPRSLAEELHDRLHRHFAKQDVEVVVERRQGERRGDSDRRGTLDEPPSGSERRTIRRRTGRRVADRRAALSPLSGPGRLPGFALPYAEEIWLVERIEPSTLELEDQDTARLVNSLQAGDDEVFSTLYERYFTRVYRSLRSTLRDAHEAEDATQQVFVQAFEAIRRYEGRSEPFRAWLFKIARNCALDQLRRQGRLVTTDPARLVELRELVDGSALATDPYGWVADRDLSAFLDRLPEDQRRVLILRFAFDLSHRETAAAVGSTEGSVRVLQHRALRFLGERLGAVRAEAGAAAR